MTRYVKLDKLIQRIGALPVFALLKPWLASSAIQQGLLYCILFLMSLALMAGLTYLYVAYQLDQLQVSSVAAGDGNHDEVDQADILEALSTGFWAAGFLVVGMASGLVFMISRRNQQQIQRIERVLSQAAQGDLSARIVPTQAYNDLGRISIAVDDMLQRLQDSVASMQDISANIAHELKTPISRLRLWLMESCEGIADEYHPHRQSLQNALSESQRISETFNALLRISQIESGVRRSRFTAVNVNELFTTVHEIYGDVAQDADMNMHCHTAEIVCMVLGDRELLIQLLANLIENALRYCPTGTNIELSMRPVWQDQCQMLILRVDDDGPGIPQAEHERVFERLYRLDKSRTNEGLGLGLSLVKAIIQLHKGRIGLEDNQPGLGVWVALPAQ